MESILKALDASRNLVVVITKDSFKDLAEESPWTKEISHALVSGKTIVPIYFDGINEIKAFQRTDHDADVEQMAHRRCRRRRNCRGRICCD